MAIELGNKRGNRNVLHAIANMATTPYTSRYTYCPSSVCQEIGSGLNARLVIRYQQYLKNINIYKYQDVRYSYTFRLENYTLIQAFIPTFTTFTTLTTKKIFVRYETDE